MLSIPGGTVVHSTVFVHFESPIVGLSSVEVAGKEHFSWGPDYLHFYFLFVPPPNIQYNKVTAILLIRSVVLFYLRLTEVLVCFALTSWRIAVHMCKFSPLSELWPCGKLDIQKLHCSCNLRSYLMHLITSSLKSLHWKRWLNWNFNCRIKRFRVFRNSTESTVFPENKT